MIRKKKKYAQPRQIFEAERIKEENKLVETFGLKNKKEIWKTVAKVKYYRGRAKALAKKTLEEQEVLFKKLRALGLKANNTADVLGLKLEDLLERRLSTVVVKKKLANTVRHARQMIVHKKILINGKAISSPSCLVSIEEEGMMTIKKKKRKQIEEPKKESLSEKPIKIEEKITEEKNK